MRPTRPGRIAAAGLLAAGGLVLGGCLATDDGRAPGGGTGAVPAGTIARRADRVPGEYLVSLRPGADEVVLRRLFSLYGLRAVEGLGGGRFLVRIADDPGPEAVRRAVLHSGEVTEVEPNFVYRALPTPRR